MKLALLKLKTDYTNKYTVRQLEAIDIQTTHLYIKFMPKTFNQLYELEKDSNIVLSEVPLYYKIKTEGHFYREPGIDANQPTYQYTIISKNYKLHTTVPYQILSEISVPFENTADFYKNVLNTNTALPIYKDLIIESFKLSGNENLIKEKLFEDYNKEAMESNAQSNVTASINQETGIFGDIFDRTWRPGGTITTWDDQLSTSIPLAGTKLVIFDYLPPFYGSVTTDQNGRFKFNTFWGRITQNLYFKSNKFEINTSDYANSILGIGNAQTSKTGYATDMSIHCRGGANEYFGTIYRAAYRYYYQDIQGLRRPPHDPFFITKLAIRAYFTGTTSNFFPNPFARNQILGIGSDIGIKKYGLTDINTFNTTIHEIAHASHWYNDHLYFGYSFAAGLFNNSNYIVPESYANAVEYAIGRIEYSSIPTRFEDLYDEYPLQPSSINSEFCSPALYPLQSYSLFGRDLINGIKTVQRVSCRDGCVIEYQDRTTGFTIKQIEDALFNNHNYYFWSWLNDIQQENPTNPTVNYVYDVWHFWQVDNNHPRMCVAFAPPPPPSTPIPVLPPTTWPIPPILRAPPGSLPTPTSPGRGGRG